jgi:hypothetical protein
VGGGGIVLEDPRDKDALSSALSAMLDAERRVACRRALVGRGAAVSIQTHVDQLLEVLTDTPRRR